MEHFYEILWGIVATIASGLATWLTVMLTTWLSKKIKDKKLADLLISITNLIMDVVRKSFQVSIESLKKSGKFDAAAQKAAKDAAIKEIVTLLTVEQKEYIMSLGVQLEEWIGLQIESSIYQLKNA